MPDRRRLQPLQRPHLLRAGACALLVLLTGSALWACGPFLPYWLLGGEREVLRGPILFFSQEIERIFPSAPPLQPSTLKPEEETAAAEEADLGALLASAPAASRQARLAAVRELRRNLAAANPPSPAPLVVPAGLPDELAEYLTGAIAFHRNDLKAARRSWEHLLGRPAAERHWRSVWAAFMLGKVALQESSPNPEEAIRRFVETRELARQGFADRLGLAAASRGFEGRAELDRGRFDRAAEIYAERKAAGDPTAMRSLQETCSEALAAGSPALLQMARSPTARRVMTAYALTPYAGDGSQPGEATGGEEPRSENAAAWLRAIEEAGVTDVEDADRLAWAAYLGGDFKATRKWLARVPRNAPSSPSPMANWLRAKLLLREGRLTEAAAILDRVRRALPAARGDSYPWI
jgi:hypothetical protein